MVTYAALQRRPSCFKSLTGLSVEAFDALFVEFAFTHAKRLKKTTVTKRTRAPRKQAVGAGRPHNHFLRDRLLMTLFWLRVYTTYEVMGFFFALHKTNVEDNVKDVLLTLETLADFDYERPSPERKKFRSVQAVMEAFPEVCLVIDAKEQRIQRPKSDKDNDRQRPYYSGKKKTHTLKTQLGVRPDGQIAAVSQSVPGGSHHDLTLLRETKLLDQLEPDEAAMMDKGYDGIQKEHAHLHLYLPCKARPGHPLTPEQKDYNRFLAKHRIVVEHTIAQMNQFQVLKQIYRPVREGHSRLVRIVAILINRRLRLQPLKTYPTAAALP